MANPTAFSWTVPAKNTDGTALQPGEVTGYLIGIRGGGTPGVYTTTLSVAGASTTTAPLSGLSSPLGSGTYQAAIQSVGPLNSAWSSEITFTVVATPLPPSGFTIA